MQAPLGYSRAVDVDCFSIEGLRMEAEVFSWINNCLGVCFGGVVLVECVSGVLWDYSQPWYPPEIIVESKDSVYAIMFAG